MGGYGAAGAAPVRYLFIDGGYLRTRYTEMMSAFFGTGTANMRDIHFGKIRASCAAEKAFYYDCLDDVKKTGETDQDVNERVADQEDFIENGEVIID